MALTGDQITTLLSEHQLLVGPGARQATFQHVSYDSRQVNTDTLFFCKGNFKPAFLASAKAAGATGYVSEQPYAQGDGLVFYQVSNIQKAMALLGAAFYGYPQNDLFIIAFTGTKGKTTSAYFEKGILDEATATKTALFSTIDRIVGPRPEQTFKSNLTTPESLDLFHDMREAVDSGMTHLVMEVSSQAYKKNRVYGLRYNVGVFLNISPDHIGRNEHPTFADYLWCKEQLLVNADVAIINAETRNVDDVYYAAKTTTAPDKIFLFAREGAELPTSLPLDFTYQNNSETLTTSAFQLFAHSERAQALSLEGTFQVGIPGDYNEGNATAAIIASGVAGGTYEAAATGLKPVHVPGRMESVQVPHHATVYVDYAHNYASLHALLAFLRGQTHAGRVIVVVGSTGDKGISRRQGFGKALSEGADVAILTTDDPGFEDPLAIVQEIDAAIDHQRVTVSVELDRQQAIAQAIQMSTPDDIVVLAGKGEDPYQKINGVDTPYPSDLVVAQTIAKGL